MAWCRWSVLKALRSWGPGRQGLYHSRLLGSFTTRSMCERVVGILLKPERIGGNISALFIESCSCSFHYDYVKNSVDDCYMYYSNTHSDSRVVYTTSAHLKSNTGISPAVNEGINNIIGASLFQLYIFHQCLTCTLTPVHFIYKMHYNYTNRTRYTCQNVYEHVTEMTTC